MLDPTYSFWVFNTIDQKWDVRFWVSQCLKEADAADLGFTFEKHYDPCSQMLKAWNHLKVINRYRYICFWEQNKGKKDSSESTPITWRSLGVGMRFLYHRSLISCQLISKIKQVCILHTLIAFSLPFATRKLFAAE